MKSTSSRAPHLRALLPLLLLGAVVPGCLLVSFDDDHDAAQPDAAQSGGDGDLGPAAGDGDGDGVGVGDGGATGSMDAGHDAGFADAGPGDAGAADAAGPCALVDGGCIACEAPGVRCVGDTALRCEATGAIEVPLDCAAAAPECQVGYCKPGFGCATAPAEGAASCGAGRYCFGPGTCQAGDCVGGEPKDCSALDTACTTGHCNEDDARCDAAPTREGLSCGERSVCASGACRGGCEGANCAVGCEAGVRCELGCGEASTCTAECGQKSTCTVDCASAGGEGCRPTCRAGASCQFDCGAAVACSAVCEVGAKCLLDCTGAAGSCTFTSCEAGATSCDDGNIACGRDCP